MQGDSEVVKRLRGILKELEEINTILRSSAVDKALEYLRIAMDESLKLKGVEGFDHYTAKVKLVNELLKEGGSCYLEAEQTKLSKIGYRPDAVIIRDDEIVIVEIETDRSRAVKKLKKLKRCLDKIKTHPIVGNRRLRIVFGILDELDEKGKELAKQLGVEVYDAKSLRRIL